MKQNNAKKMLWITIVLALVAVFALQGTAFAGAWEVADEPLGEAVDVPVEEPPVAEEPPPVAEEPDIAEPNKPEEEPPAPIAPPAQPTLPPGEQPRGGKIVVVGAPKSMAVGSAKQLRAYVQYADGTIDKNIPLTWQPSGAKYLAVGKNGYIRAKSAGVDEIIVDVAVSNPHQIEHAHVTIRVNKPADTSVTIKNAKGVYQPYTVKKGSGKKVVVKQLAKSLPAIQNEKWSLSIKNGDIRKARYTTYYASTGKVYAKNTKNMLLPSGGDAVVRLTYNRDGQVVYYYFKVAAPSVRPV